MASKKIVAKAKNKLLATLVTDKRQPCAFCKREVDDEATYGKLYAIGDIQVHYFCALLSCCLVQKGRDSEGLFGFLYHDIIAEVERSKKHKCSYCNTGGASLGCSKSQCRKQFHLPCGRAKHAVSLFFGNYKSFCQQHAPKQKIPDHIMAQAKLRMKKDKGTLKIAPDGATISVAETVCVICYEEVQGYPSPDTFWPPCCARDAWFHRSCLQRMALSAGMHYLKCPLCNDKDQFYSSVVGQGLYVPDRDAAWELEQDAFAEIYERPSTCSAEQCLCDRGRKHTETNGSWEIQLCLLCGTAGAHAHCSAGARFVCGVCRACAPGDMRALSDRIQAGQYIHAHCSAGARFVCGVCRACAPGDMRALSDRIQAGQYIHAHCSAGARFVCGVCRACAPGDMRALSDRIQAGQYIHAHCSAGARFVCGVCRACAPGDMRALSDRIQAGQYIHAHCSAGARFVCGVCRACAPGDMRALSDRIQAGQYIHAHCSAGARFVCGVCRACAPGDMRALSDRIQAGQYIHAHCSAGARFVCGVCRACAPGDMRALSDRIQAGQYIHAHCSAGARFVCGVCRACAPGDMRALSDRIQAGQYIHAHCSAGARFVCGVCRACAPGDMRALSDRIQAGQYIHAHCSAGARFVCGVCRACAPGDMRALSDRIQAGQYIHAHCSAGARFVCGVCRACAPGDMRALSDRIQAGQYIHAHCSAGARFVCGVCRACAPGDMRALSDRIQAGQYIHAHCSAGARFVCGVCRACAPGDMRALSDRIQAGQYIHAHCSAGARFVCGVCRACAPGDMRALSDRIQAGQYIHAHCSAGARFVCGVCRACAPGDMRALSDRIQAVIESEERQSGILARRPVMPSRMSLRRTKQHASRPSTSQIINTHMETTESDDYRERNSYSDTASARLVLNLRTPRRQPTEQHGSVLKTIENTLFSPTKLVEEGLTKKMQCLGVKDVNSDRVITKVKEKLTKPRPLCVKKKIVNSVLDQILLEIMKEKHELKQWRSPKKTCDTEEPSQKEDNIDNNKDSDKETTKEDVKDKVTTEPVEDLKVEDDSSNSTFQLPSEFIADHHSDDSLPLFETPKKLTTVDIQKDSSLEISENNEIVNINVVKIKENGDSKELMKNLKLQIPVKTEKCAFKFNPIDKESLVENNLNMDVESFKNFYLNEVEREKESQFQCNFKHKHTEKSCKNTKIRTALDFAVDATKAKEGKRKTLKRKQQNKDGVANKRPKRDKEIVLNYKKAESSNIKVVCSNDSNNTESIDVTVNDQTTKKTTKKRQNNKKRRGKVTSTIDLTVETAKNKKRLKKMKKNKKHRENIQVKIRFREEQVRLKITKSQTKDKKLKNKKVKEHPKKLTQCILQYAGNCSPNKVIVKPEHNVTPKKRNYVRLEKSPDTLFQTSIQSFFKIVPSNVQSKL